MSGDQFTNAAEERTRRPYQCIHCRWFDRFENDSKGLCRREGPLWINNAFSTWPSVKLFDWCGQFAIKEDYKNGRVQSQ